MNMRTHRLALLGGLAVLLAGAGSEAWAQQAAAELGPDSFLLVVPIREMADIENELVVTRQARSQADRDRAAAEGLRSGAKARIDRKKAEIDAINNRQKVARNEKREADATALGVEKQAAEREKVVLERRESLRGAEVELEKRRVELADARRVALEMERELAARRASQSRAGDTSGPAKASAERVLADLEKRTLEAQRKEAEKTAEVADNQKRIIERLLGVLEAQRKLVAGG
jgi:hypothetical protein